MPSTRYKAISNPGFGWCVQDTEQPETRAVCWVDQSLVNAAEIAERIASALNASGEVFDLSHEEDD